MLAYVILAHQDFDAIYHLMRGLYDEENIYCISVGRKTISKAFEPLQRLRQLSNVQLISTPPTMWGGIVEAIMHSIEFCRKFDNRWRNLVILSSSDVPLLAQQLIMEKVERDFHDKILLKTVPLKIDLNADRSSEKKLYSDPLVKSGDYVDIANYTNPFNYKRPTYEREGVRFTIGPGVTRPGWPRRDTNFSTLLSFVQNRSDISEVYFDEQPIFVRRAFAHYFKNRDFGNGGLFGILPRDFCEFLCTSEEALTLYAMTRHTFSCEETFFSTMALNTLFRNRVIDFNHFYSGPSGNQNFTCDDIRIIAQNINRPLFARRMPSQRSASPTYEEVYECCHIKTHPTIESIYVSATAPIVKPQKIFWDALTLAGKTFEFGVLAAQKICDVTFLDDGALDCPPEFAHQAGLNWRIGDEGLEILSGDGVLFARYDGVRIIGQKIILFGYWLHSPVLTLVFAGQSVVALLDGLFQNQRIVNSSLANFLDAHFSARIWLCGEEGDSINLNRNGTISISSEEVGRWAEFDEHLYLFGIPGSPVLQFPIKEVDLESKSVPGLAWGRQTEIEPCMMLIDHPIAVDSMVASQQALGEEINSMVAVTPEMAYGVPETDGAGGNSASAGDLAPVGKT